MSQHAIKYDAIDQRILEILQKDGRITNAQLSKDIGLSPAPTLERVRKLEQTGVIKSFHANLDAFTLGLGISTFLLVSLKGHKKEFIEPFIQKIHEVDQVVECHHITGEGDFMLKVVATDIAAYREFILDVISEITEVANIKTINILKTEKDSNYLPIPPSFISYPTFD